MMVSFGTRPPSVSLSSRSRGSYAILFPPANADPACDVVPFGGEVVVGDEGSDDIDDDVVVPPPTRRLWRPPEDIWKEEWMLLGAVKRCRSEHRSHRRHTRQASFTRHFIYTSAFATPSRPASTNI